ncbi:MAG: hypothetical protein ACOVOO_12275 [Flavobacteriales bacterium]|jgi:hypothetical protein
MNTKFLHFTISPAIAILLISCGGTGSTKEKLPGWYESTIVYENGDSLIGKVTYYKNGQNKMEADYIMHPIGGMSISAKIIIEGHWEVRNDELFETVDKVSATPRTLQEVIETAMKKGKELPGSKIIEVDEHGLVLEDQKGKQTTYKRLKK